MDYRYWLALGVSVSLTWVGHSRNQNGSTVRISGSLPSQAHIDLLKAGIINDPLLGINGEVRGHSR